MSTAATLAGTSEAGASSCARRTASSCDSIRRTFYALIMASRQRRDPKRGRHRARGSPETAAWERDHLIPEQPGYLDASTYVGLVRLRNLLELGDAALDLSGADQRARVERR